jgi:hypothetical protein
MILIKTQFIAHIEDKEECTGNAQGHPQDIKETVPEFIGDVPEGIFN